MDHEEIFYLSKKIIHQKKFQFEVLKFQDDIQTEEQLFNYLNEYCKDHDMKIFSYVSPIDDIDDGITYISLEKLDTYQKSSV
ncbi:MAG: hypothetical protein OEZ01_18240 [Candidatus Heimdallarchaeota archaeon]|nr:hypothetical protein [Candidatus Heimdallarchaeota archaeon]MDH5647956.1 hypothetical protein [Candidatus Heimdallarchaeota archaeon]